MKNVFICILIIIISGLFTVSLSADEKSQQPETIQCRDGKHSYVVYLPPDYDRSKKWPVLFCFDSQGFGELAAMQFSSAAVNQHWVVIGSLDPGNGPWQPILEAQDAIMDDVFHRYNMDTKRLYAAGFSGGARAAYTMAYRCPDSFRGVIACGAGFGLGNASNKVAVFHCAGDKDFRHDEIVKAHNYLVKRGIKSNLREYEGVHQYPPKEIILEALDWMENNTNK